MVSKCEYFIYLFLGGGLHIEILLEAFLELGTDLYFCISPNTSRPDQYPEVNLC